MVAANELSVPAFLLHKYGMDFLHRSGLAKGGNGSICTCHPINQGLIERSAENELVAKVITEGRVTDRERRAFYQELASSDWRFRHHDFFPKVYAYSEVPLILVMKFYAGGNLLSLILNENRELRCPYTKVMVVRFFRQVCTAVSVMHSTGLAHCDIKPANVLLDVRRDGSVIPILSDFGISRVIEASALKVYAFALSELKGMSLAYAAPEALVRFRSRGNEVRPDVWKAGDIYALSVTLYEMLLRRRRIWSK